jgi:hypothetical protein
MCLLESLCPSVLTNFVPPFNLSQPWYMYALVNIIRVISTRMALDLKMSRSHEFCLLHFMEYRTTKRSFCRRSACPLHQMYGQTMNL